MTKKVLFEAVVVANDDEGEPSAVVSSFLFFSTDAQAARDTVVSKLKEKNNLTPEEATVLIRPFC